MDKFEKIKSNNSHSDVINDQLKPLEEKIFKLKQDIDVLKQSVLGINLLISQSKDSITKIKDLLSIKCNMEYITQISESLEKLVEENSRKLRIELYKKASVD